MYTYKYTYLNRERETHVYVHYVCPYASRGTAAFSSQGHRNAAESWPNSSSAQAAKEPGEAEEGRPDARKARQTPKPGSPTSIVIYRDLSIHIPWEILDYTRRVCIYIYISRHSYE